MPIRRRVSSRPGNPSRGVKPIAHSQAAFLRNTIYAVSCGEQIPIPRTLTALLSEGKRNDAAVNTQAIAVGELGRPRTLRCRTITEPETHFLASIRGFRLETARPQLK